MFCLRASKTIEKFHPSISAEVSTDDLDGIMRLQITLRDYAYLSMHMPPLFNPDNPNGVKSNVWGENVVSYKLLATMAPPPDDKFLVPLSDFLETREPAEVLPQSQEEAPIPLEPADGRG